ncbi:unnamed protein product [Symbiodinium natans]|uniref:Uncharacterized protein n=1 Tax=Symbiodinium natans TaxID=878477 RepID=A0A812FY44_9DINO|nr:unnamed protein product [Symbiodinium natans]
MFCVIAACLCVSVKDRATGIDEFGEELLPFLRLLVDDAGSKASPRVEVEASASEGELPFRGTPCASGATDGEAHDRELAGHGKPLWSADICRLSLFRIMLLRL